MSKFKKYDLFSFEVFKSKSKAKKLFPNAKIIEYKRGDIEAPTMADDFFAKGGTLSEKAVKKNYIRRDRYDKLKKEKDAKIDELKDANKDKVSDLKKDLKDKGADCYDDIKQTKKDIGKKIAKEMQKKQLDYEQGCADDIEDMSKDCDRDVAYMADKGYNMSERAKKEKTESLILGGIGGLLLGIFFIK